MAATGTEQEKIMRLAAKKKTVRTPVKKKAVAQKRTVPETTRPAAPTAMQIPVPAKPAPVEEFVREPYEEVNALRLYVREIGATPLLTVAEENELAAKIKNGDKKARERMIKANLRLVVKIARDYEGYGVPLLDLISEGNIGLMKAVERFDPAKGAKLSTYGAWWIKEAIKRALANQAKTIRLPSHVVDKLFHIRRASAKLEDMLGREPTDQELAEETGLTALRVRKLLAASAKPASLDAPLGEDGSNRVMDVVADEQAHTPYQQLAQNTDTDMVREVVKSLDEREATILKMRFGLDGASELTLEEVGQKFGLTRERIRQIQEIALRKLRHRITQLERVKQAA